MLKNAKHYLLPLIVFITGASVLMIEIVATRVLSPFYGNTIFTVSSVISVILAALSFGYYVGGKVSDKYPNFKWFFRIIVLSGLILFMTHFLGLILLPVLSKTLSITAGPLISSLLLFFVPAFFLGMLSPYAVKLQSINFPEEGLGSIAGNIFFWSTLGSIIGSLLSGFVLIPRFGVNNIIIGNAIGLFLTGVIPLIFLREKKYIKRSTLILFFFFSLSIVGVHISDSGTIYSKDGIYEKISVYDREFFGRKTRFFEQDRSYSAAMYLDSTDPKDLVYLYSKYYTLYKVFKPDIRDVLIIGGGAYSIPKAILADNKDVRVHVAEIEPSLFSIAKEYFNLTPNPRLENYVADGRQLLQGGDTKYDMIFSDVYSSLYSIPAQFTTEEFFSIAKEKLNENGIFMANIIGDLVEEDSSFIISEIKTFQSVFPNSYFFATESPDIKDVQNIIFVGYKSDLPIDLKSKQIVSNADLIIRTLFEKRIDTEKIDFSKYRILTDDYSPVEYMIGKVLKRSF